MSFIAARSFKVKDPKTGQIIQLKPGDDVPGGNQFPNAKRYESYGYIVPSSLKATIGLRHDHAPNQAVDPDGNPIAPEDLPRFKAWRDVKAITDKRVLIKKAEKAGVDLRVCKDERDVREALCERYEIHYGGGVENETTLAEATGHAGSGEEDKDDEIYIEERLDELTKADLEKIGTEDFGIQFGSRDTHDQMVAAIVAASWTPKALVKLSNEKLVEIGREDWELEVDEAMSTADLVSKILTAQEGDGGGGEGDATDESEPNADEGEPNADAAGEGGDKVA